VINLFKGLESEVKIQDREDVKLTRDDMARKYNVNDAMITEAVNVLCEHKFIVIIQESLRKRRFRILKELPVNP
jgi:hypothetical protein